MLTVTAFWDHQILIIYVKYGKLAMLEYHKVFRSNSCEVSGQLQCHPAMDNSKRVSPLTVCPLRKGSSH